MALGAGTLFEVAALGSDGNAGSDAQSGGFNPSNANSITDLTTDASTGNTATPVVSSATYTFVAGDVSHWCFIQGSGTWTLPATTLNGIAATPTGIWAKITAVNGGKATLNAAIGSVVLYGTGGPFGVSTTIGISTQATPTSGKLLVDYSQCGTPRVSSTTGITAGTTTIQDTVTSPFTKVMPGNLMYITGGTGTVTAAVYEIVSDTNTNTVIVDRNTGLTAGTGATIKVGGCLASPGMAGAWHVAGNHIFIKKATYTITSALLNDTGRCLSLTGSTSVNNQTAVFGYNTIRTDAPKTTNRPTLIADGVINTFVIITMASGAVTTISYLILDGLGSTSSRAVTSGNNANRAYFVTAKNCTNSAFAGGLQFACDATGCSTQPAFIASTPHYCAAWSNTITGFGTTSTLVYFCLAVNNTGTSDGFSSISSAGSLIGCTAYANGRDGFRFTCAVGSSQHAFNCISYGNTGLGFNSTAASDLLLLVNCAAGSNSTNFATNITSDSMLGCLTLTADPFTNAAGSNFGLNTAGAQYSSLHATSFVGAYPGLPNTVNNSDIGGVQSSGTGGGNQTFGDG